MLFRITLLASLLALLTAPALAADRNQDGVDDAATSDLVFGDLDIGDIALVDTGDYSVSQYLLRLGGLGYTVDTIPPSSNFEDLSNYSLVILPVGHGNAGNYATFAALADDYIAYVASGGGLWVGQPNPFGMPGNEADISWVPYALRLSSGYNNTDCPTVTVDDTHCITMGLPNTNFSTAGDTVVEMGPEWTVLAVGPVTGNPGTMVASHGSGKILVELTHPAMGSVCPMDDAALDRYVTCTIGGVVARESTSWGSVKALYRP